MFKVWFGRLVLVTLAAGGAAACDEDTPTTPNNRRDPVTVTFTGELTQNGSKTHTFSTAGSGNITATLKQIAPDSSLVVGFSLGNWNGTSCQLVFTNDAATQGAVLPGTISGIGDLCVRVHDVGNIAATPAAYTVEVIHP